MRGGCLIVYVKKLSTMPPTPPPRAGGRTRQFQRFAIEIKERLTNLALFHHRPSII
jgi:hypothetical protein